MMRKSLGHTLMGLAVAFGAAAFAAGGAAHKATIERGTQVRTPRYLLTGRDPDNMNRRQRERAKRKEARVRKELRLHIGGAERRRRCFLMRPTTPVADAVGRMTNWQRKQWHGYCGLNADATPRSKAERDRLRGDDAVAQRFAELPHGRHDLIYT
jgi:hypothetical protein